MSDIHNMRGRPNTEDRPSEKEAVLRAAKVFPEIATLIDEDALNALSEPEFRVLSLMGERKGIRLEAIFWQALDQVASDLKVPRNTLVLWIMTAAGHERHNVTSVLRSVLLAYLLDDIKRLKKSAPENG